MVVRIGETVQGRPQRAIVVVDMVNDFITGVFGSAYAKDMVERSAPVLAKMQQNNEIVFTMDTHLKADPEFKVWGEHCVAGTEGSLLYRVLEGIKGHRIRKRHFDSFHDSDLDGLLRALNITEIYLCGISTDICVLHTAAGAYFRYYGITVVKDMCASIDPKNHEDALQFMKRNYGARIIDSEEMIREVA